MSLQTAFDRIAYLETPEAVAEYLVGHGIKGFRGEINHCPLAVYFDKENETSNSEIGVTESGINRMVYTYDPVTDLENWEDEHLFSCTLVMTAFVEKFDDGEFDMLNEEFEGIDYPEDGIFDE